jgi:hypothetical protein
MRSRDIIALAVAIVVTCSIFYPFFTGGHDLQRQFSTLVGAVMAGYIGIGIINL